MEPRIAIELIAGAVALGGVALTQYLKWKTEKKKAELEYELQQAKLEMAFTHVALDLGQFIENYDELYHDIERLLEETNVDRFVLLRAWNGKLAPRWASSVMQVRTMPQKFRAYIHFELDPDYVMRLTEIHDRRYAYYVTNEMPEGCAIKEVYKVEGVYSAMWAEVDRRKGPKGSDLVTYCSFATHNENGLSESDIVLCKGIVGRLKGLAADFYDKCGYDGDKPMSG